MIENSEEESRKQACLNKKILNAKICQTGEDFLAISAKWGNKKVMLVFQLNSSTLNNGLNFEALMP